MNSMNEYDYYVALITVTATEEEGLRRLPVHSLPNFYLRNF